LRASGICVQTPPPAIFPCKSALFEHLLVAGLIDSAGCQNGIHPTLPVSNVLLGAHQPARGPVFVTGTASASHQMLVQPATEDARPVSGACSRYPKAGNGSARTVLVRSVPGATATRCEHEKADAKQHASDE
jgi:hypothetical protein